MKRRGLLATIGIALAWPLVTVAQSERVRRLGMLFSDQSDPDQRARAAAFLDRMLALGWEEGRNLRLDYRWGAGSGTPLTDRNAQELIDMAPDGLVVSGGTSAAALRARTKTIPIVFQNVVDPVALGLVDSLSHPGGNITGLTNWDFAMAGKWVSLLKDLAPATRRVMFVNWSQAPLSWLPPLQAAARALSLELSVAAVASTQEVEAALVAFARPGDRPGGVVVLSSSFMARNRDAVIRLVTAARLPAVYGVRYYATSGGLVSYGPDYLDLYRQGADMMDRILRGESPANIPVRNPTKYEFVVNLKTAKALGLTVPLSLLATADEVIE